MLNTLKVLSKHALHFQSVEQICSTLFKCWAMCWVWYLVISTRLNGPGALFKNFLSTLASWRWMWSWMSSTGFFSVDQFRMCGLQTSISCVFDFTPMWRTSMIWYDMISYDMIWYDIYIYNYIHNIHYILHTQCVFFCFGGRGSTSWTGASAVANLVVGSVPGLQRMSPIPCG